LCRGLGFFVVIFDKVLENGVVGLLDQAAPCHVREECAFGKAGKPTLNAMLHRSLLTSTQIGRLYILTPLC
jgi:hypothetical protein